MLYIILMERKFNDCLNISWIHFIPKTLCACVFSLKCTCPDIAQIFIVRPSILYLVISSIGLVSFRDFLPFASISYLERDFLEYSAIPCPFICWIPFHENLHKLRQYVHYTLRVMLNLFRSASLNQERKDSM